MARSEKKVRQSQNSVSNKNSATQNIVSTVPVISSAEMEQGLKVFKELIPKLRIDAPQQFQHLSFKIGHFIQQNKDFSNTFITALLEVLSVACDWYKDQLIAYNHNYQTGIKQNQERSLLLMGMNIFTIYLQSINLLNAHTGSYPKLKQIIPSINLSLTLLTDKQIILSKFSQAMPLMIDYSFFYQLYTSTYNVLLSIKNADYISNESNNNSENASNFFDYSALQNNIKEKLKQILNLISPGIENINLELFSKKIYFLGELTDEIVKLRQNIAFLKNLSNAYNGKLKDVIFSDMMNYLWLAHKKQLNVLLSSLNTASPCSPQAILDKFEDFNQEQSLLIQKNFPLLNIQHKKTHSWYQIGILIDFIKSNNNVLVNFSLQKLINILQNYSLLKKEKKVTEVDLHLLKESEKLLEILLAYAENKIQYEKNTKNNCIYDIISYPKELYIIVVDTLATYFPQHTSLKKHQEKQIEIKKLVNNEIREAKKSRIKKENINNQGFFNTENFDENFQKLSINKDSKQSENDDIELNSEKELIKTNGKMNKLNKMNHKAKQLLMDAYQISLITLDRSDHQTTLKKKITCLKESYEIYKELYETATSIFNHINQSHEDTFFIALKNTSVETKKITQEALAKMKEIRSIIKFSYNEINTFLLAMELKKQTLIESGKWFEGNPNSPSPVSVLIKELHRAKPLIEQLILETVNTVDTTHHQRSNSF